MHFIRTATMAFGVLGSLLTGTIFAGTVDPVEMANKVGFTGCDSLISSSFEHAIKSGDKRISISYFPETAKNTVDLQATFGKPNDTVYQTIHFEKSGGSCFSYQRSMISEEGSCSGVIARNMDKFKYVAESGGAIWTENAGGVDKLHIQAGNMCIIVFQISKKERASR